MGDDDDEMAMFDVAMVMIYVVRVVSNMRKEMVEWMVSG